MGCCRLRVLSDRGRTAARPYVGTWDCTRPAMRQAWHAKLTVTPTHDGKLEFIEAKTSLYGPSSNPRYIEYDPGTDLWSERLVDDPFVASGKLVNNVITFSDPRRREAERFALA